MSDTEVTTEVQVIDDDNLDAFSSDFFGQKKDEGKPETKASPAEQEKVEETKSSEEAEAQLDDTATDDEQDEAELKEEIPDKPKRKTVQDRIDELVRQREEQKRTDAEEMRKLREELEAFKQGQTPKVEAPKEPQPDALDANGEPIYALGEFDPQYIRDLTKFTLDTERERVRVETEAAQQQSKIEQEQQALQATWNGKVTEAAKEYPDFVEKGQALLSNFNNLDPNYAGYLSSVLMNMEKGPDVLYYLSNHPDEANAIVNSGAQKATLALGRIESRFLQSEQDAPKPKVTKAPPPPQERARGTNGAFIAVAPDTDDLKAFEMEFFKKA